MIRNMIGRNNAGQVVRTTTRAGRKPGWSPARVKRAAKKRCNVLRNRLAHRGRRT